MIKNIIVSVGIIALSTLGGDVVGEEKVNTDIMLVDDLMLEIEQKENELKAEQEKLLADKNNYVSTITMVEANEDGYMFLDEEDYVCYVSEEDMIEWGLDDIGEGDSVQAIFDGLNEWEILGFKKF